MNIGYARVSTADQTIDLQKDALAAAGCEKIYSDTASGSKTDRQGLADAMQQLRKGDVLVVWRLDRLGRTLKQLIELVNDLNSKGVGFKSLQENMDSTTSGGKFIFHVFGALAEFERTIIQERTNAGLSAARSRGRLGGRPKKLNATDTNRLYKLYDSKEYQVSEICEMLAIPRSTFYKYLKLRSVSAQS